MRRLKQRPGQIDEFWPSKKPGREGDQDPWCLTWYEAGQTRRKSFGTTDFNEACRLVAQHALIRGKPSAISRDSVQISVAIAQYWEEHAQNIPSAYNQKTALSKWNEFWGGKMVSDITRVEQGKFVKFLGGDRLAPSTIDHVLSAGRAALNWAVNHERLESSPKIWLTETEEDRRSRPPMAIPITPETAAPLFDAVEERTTMIFLVLSMCTLARPGAIYDLRREQYDAERGTICMNPAGRRQTKKYRPTLLVPPTLRPWLESVTDPKRFYVTQHGERMKNVNSGLKSALERADLPAHITGYSFRHGLSRWMRKCRVPEEQIDHYLGHLPRGGAKMTRIYAPFEAEDCPEACDAIEKFVTEVRARLKTANLDNPAAPDAGANGDVPMNLKGRKSRGHLSDERREALKRAIKSGIGITEAKRVFGIGCPTFYRYRNLVLGRPIRRWRADSVPDRDGTIEN